MLESNYNRTEQKSLSFHGEQLLRQRHKIHPYPAMLHPLLVDFLIEKYAKAGDTIFDPFCGSGVTLLQSKVKGYESMGFDINPIALLIARAKTTNYEKEKLLVEYKDLKTTLIESKDPLFSQQLIDIPKITNIDYWYTEEVAGDLGKIRWILKNKVYDYKDFFITIFAFICRNQSLTRNGEFKRYRINKERIAKTKNEVFSKFLFHLEDMVKIFSNTDISKKSCKPMLGNSEDKIPSEIKYDLVITSPPYGDSGTTVAYGQYTSFGADWINDLINNNTNGYKIDKEGLGKEGKLNKQLNKYEILMDTIDKIESADPKRAKEILHFFNGYYNVIKNVVKNLNKKGRVCFIVGNRTVRGFQIPMDQITATFLNDMNLNFEGIFVRDIHNKVMPSKNSPTNIAGVKSKTMTNEYVVVFNKK